MKGTPRRIINLRLRYVVFKGIDEIDFKNVDENGQTLALLRSAAGF
jgi:hypothetical protein